MPSTTYTSTTMSVRNVGARTDFAGGAVSDLTAEEDRLAYEILAEGIFSPVNAFQVVAGAGATMNVVIGSGAAKIDLALLVGATAGQSNYMARLDETTKTIALSAADGSLARKDEVYLVIRDDAYDSSTRALPVLAVREGDPDASPSLPGPDAAWKAYLLLAQVDVPAAAADILACSFTDQRVVSAYALGSGAVLTRNLADTETQVRAENDGDTIGFYINDILIASFDALGWDHGDLQGKGDDDHTQYHTDARALSWLNTQGLAQLADVGVTTPTNRNALMADGDSWESRPLVEADISDLAHTTARTDAEIEDLAGGLVTGNTETFIEATYQPSDNTLDLVVPVLDEDDMFSNSPTDLATQQSIKQYVDAAILAIEYEETFSFPLDDLEVYTGIRELVAEENRTIVKIHAHVTGAPTGASIVADVLKDAVTLFTTPGERPTILVTEFDSSEDLPDIVVWGIGTGLTVDIVQIGSTLPGTGFTLTIVYTKDA